MHSLELDSYVVNPATFVALTTANETLGVGTDIDFTFEVVLYPGLKEGWKDTSLYGK